MPAVHAHAHATRHAAMHAKKQSFHNISKIEFERVKMYPNLSPPYFRAGWRIRIGIPSTIPRTRHTVFFSFYLVRLGRRAVQPCRCSARARCSGPEERRAMLGAGADVIRGGVVSAVLRHVGARRRIRVPGVSVSLGLFSCACRSMGAARSLLFCPVLVPHK